MPQNKDFSLHECVWEVLVPVALGVLVEGGEHDGEDLGGVVTD